MNRQRTVRIVLVVVLGLVVVAATGAISRYLIESWQDSLRMPLIAASIAGILFIIIAPSLVRTAD